MFNSFLVIAISAILALGALIVLVRRAEYLGLVQGANARSSHLGTRPTGGGAGILFATLVSGTFVAVQSVGLVLVPLVLATFLSLVGLADDLKNLSKRLRLVAQFVAVGCLLVFFELGFGLTVFLAQIGPLWVLLPALLIWGALWINLFNFMDGIDGMATSEAVFVLLSMVALASLSPQWELAGVWLWLACIAVAGMVFLFFNWSPAKIFMGDAGAYLFAFSIFLGAVWGLVSGELSPFASFVLIALFVSDSVVTLVRRVLSGQNWRGGHRTHAYQYLSRRYSHAKATLIYLGVNVLWLLPLAYLTQSQLISPYLSMFIAYVPLIAVLFWGNAGKPEPKTPQQPDSNRRKPGHA